MKIETFNVSSPLDFYVRQLWLWQQSVGGVLPCMFPGTGAELLFNLAEEPIELEINGIKRCLGRDALVCCPRKYRLQLKSKGAVKLLSIRFRSSGFYLLFNIPMQQLVDQLYFLSDISPLSDLQSIFDNVSDTQRLFLLERWLMQKLDRLKPYRNSFFWAVDQIYYRREQCILNTVKAEVACSERSFQRKFKIFTGVDAKYFSRTARFQSSLKHLLACSSNHFSDISQDTQFYDQSHFIKEFKHFSGLSPSEYLVEKNFKLNYYTSSHLIKR